MAKPLRFHPDVAVDVRAARRWYADICEELGDSFRELLDARFDDIEGHPQHFGAAFDDVRFAQMKRFPYSNRRRGLAGAVSGAGLVGVLGQV